MKKACSYGTALLLTFVLLLCGVLLFIDTCLNDRALHLSVAQEPAVIANELQKIQEAAADVAASVGFDPALCDPYLTEETVSAYAEEAVDWWMQLLRGEVTDAPVFTADGLADAIRADAVFQSRVPSAQRKKAARDQGAYGVTRAAEKCILPVRTSLLQIAADKGAESIVRLRGLMDTALPVSAGAAGVLLLLLAVLGFTGSAGDRFRYIAAAFSAAGVLVLLGCAALTLTDLPGMLGQMNPLLEQQAQLLLSKLMTRIIPIAAAALVAGAAMNALSGRDKGKKA